MESVAENFRGDNIRMQDNERVIDSFLEVLKDRIMKQEDCEEILSQVGALCVPEFVPCKVVVLKKSKFQFVDKQ